MKTSVELNESKVELAKSLGGMKTIRDLLDHALDAYIAKVRRRNMASMLGTDFSEGDLITIKERKKDVD